MNWRLPLRVGRIVGCSTVFVLLSSAAEAQTVVTSAGRHDPIVLAPGESTTLQIPGLELLLERPLVLRERPLPFVAAGFSLQLERIDGQEPIHPIPIFSVRQVSDCPPFDQAPYCRTTLVSIQVPYEVDPNVFPGYFQPRSPGGRRKLANYNLRVSVDGVSKYLTPVGVVPGNLRVLTTCDVALLTDDSPDLPDICVPLVRLPDGSFASERRVRPGTELRIYATGFATTAVEAGRLVTGVPAPSDPPVDFTTLTLLEAGVNLPPAAPWTFRTGNNSPLTGSTPVRLVPGQIGIYEIRVIAPEVPSSIAGACLEANVSGTSNVTFTITGRLRTVGALGSVDYGGATACVGRVDEMYE